MASAISLAILKDFSLLTLLFVFLTLLAVLGYLLTNKAALSKKYLALEDKAAIPKTNDKALYGKHKPTVKGLAPWAALLGLFSCYPAYLAAHGDQPTRLAKIAFQLGGVPGVVFFWAIIGTTLLAVGIENWLGYRYSQKSALTHHSSGTPNGAP
ncbi:MAG: hypothetical protein ACAH07_06175 [Methylophilaceae bacterium]|nr:hypothetical protein [Methyloradius sp.]